MLVCCRLSRQSAARWRCRVGVKTSRLASVSFDVASAPTTCRPTTSGSVPARPTPPTRPGSTSTCRAVSEAAPVRHRALPARRPSRRRPGTGRSLAGCSLRLPAATGRRTTRTVVRRCSSSTNRTSTGQSVASVAQRQRSFSLKLAVIHSDGH